MNRIDFPGRPATIIDNWVLAPLLKQPGEIVIIHHISQNTPFSVQLEIERRSPSGIKFERYIAKT